MIWQVITMPSPRTTYKVTHVTQEHYDKSTYLPNGKMFEARGKSITELEEEKNKRLMEGIGVWTAYYRSNPHRLAKEYLNINLKLFQKILLYLMMLNNYFLFIGSRGIGKTYISALYCVLRCILYPGTKVVIVSGTKGQARQVISKIINELCVSHGWGSENLNREINEKKDGINDAKIGFTNGSFIKVVSANDNARGNRANVIVVDEFRMVSPKVLDTVLKKFLTVPRTPPYLNNPKYAHLQERNIQMYLSSAWYQNHWSFEKAKDFIAKSLDDRVKYFACALPYQVAVKEGLANLDAIEEEMSEADFDEIKWSMEMDATFYGAGTDAFFKYDDVNNARKLKKALYPEGMFNVNRLNEVPPLIEGERRILSLDVALMASNDRRKNDAAALIINRAIPDGKIYHSNIVYIDTYEGLRTEELALITRRLYSWFNCTDLVIDTNGSNAR